MKGFTFIPLLQVLASAAFVPLEPRQMGGMNMDMHKGSSGAASEISAAQMAAYAKMFTGGLPTAKMFKVEEQKPKLGASNERIKFTYGPYALHGANSKEKTGNMPSLDKYGTSYQYMIGDDFPRDVTILYSKSEVQDSNFERSDIAKGIYNHHDVFFNLNRGAPSIVNCGSKAMKSPYGGFGLRRRNNDAFEMPQISIFIGGATEEGDSYYTTADGQYKSGYYIGPKDRLTFGLDVVNYNNKTENVYVVGEIEYVQGKIAGAGQANGQVVGLGMCDGVNAIDIHTPKGETKFVLDGGNDVTFTRDGTFLGLGAHLHDGGVKMVYTINGKEVCTVTAEYGGEGHTGKTPDGKDWSTIRQMHGCPGPIDVKKGDKLGMKAYYDTELHPSREEAGGEDAEQMALLTGMFVIPASS